MINVSVASDAFVTRGAPRSFRPFLVGALVGIVPGAFALGLSLLTVGATLHPLPLSIAAPAFVPPPAAVAAAAASRRAAIAAAVAPKPEVAALADGAASDPEFAAASPARPSVAESDVQPGSRMLVAALSTQRDAPPMWERAASALGDAAPSPPAPPAEVATPASAPAAVRHFALNGQGAVPAAPLPDGRTMDKLFGGANAPVAAPAYASAESGLTNVARSGAAGPLARYDRWTAVYDLAAHTVYLPDGARLEAHSGLGSRLDDPAHVNERNRGATPPHVYELASLDQPFHGVHALRLNPIGDGGIFGRDGLLAHTYMLGPRGDSNGCVVFRNYSAFLQAFQTGQVKRLAVVARLD